MQRPNRPRRGVEMGGVTSFIDKDTNTETQHDNRPTHSCVGLDEEFPMPDDPAYIGLQLSAGMSTMHARQKLSATAWITVPVENDDVEIADGFERCYDIVSTEVDRRLNEGAEKFFPNLSKEDK